jgi:hypothetical protein
VTESGGKSSTFILLLHASLWWNSLLSAAKNGRSKRGTRGSAVHHQLDRVDV